MPPGDSHGKVLPGPRMPDCSTSTPWCTDEGLAETSEWLERLAAHGRMTVEKYGRFLPIVDYEAEVDCKALRALDCDENRLALWLVERHPELSPSEVIVERVVGPYAVVLYAGTTKGRPCGYHEHRLLVEIGTEEDLTWYVDKTTFRMVATQQVCDEIEDDRIELRVPRWANR